MLEYLIGPVKAVSGMLAQLVLPGDNPDVASLVMEHENGALSTVNASYASASEYYVMNVYGKEAGAYYDLHQGLRLLKRGADRSEPVAVPKIDALVDELEEFARAVRGTGQPEMGGDRATASLAVIRAGIKSAQEGRRVAVADAKARPGRLTVGNSGVGSHTHISSAALFKAAGVDIIEVPHGAAQVVPNLIGGHIDAVVQLRGALSTHVKAGTVRLLATLTSQRDPVLPDVPTARERGVNASLEAWRGIAVPRGTPAPVVAALEAAIRKTVEAPEFARACEELGIHPAFMPAAEFGPLIAKEDAELAALMQQIGLKKQP